MAQLVGTLFFKVGDAGWSETYPLVASDYAGAKTAMIAVLDKRLDLAAGDVTAIAGRVSDTDIRGDSDPLSLFPAAGQYGSLPAIQSFRPYITILYRATATPLHRALRHLHAIPSNQFNSRGELVFTTDFEAALNAFEVAIKDNCAVAHKIPNAVTPPFYQFFPVTGVTTLRQSTKRVGRPFGLPVGRRLVG